MGRLYIEIANSHNICVLCRPDAQAQSLSQAGGPGRS